MKALFKSADLYLAESDWKDLTLIKFCLFSMGVLIACLLPREKQRPARIAALTVFLCTYIPLMYKYFRVLRAALRPSKGE